MMSAVAGQSSAKINFDQLMQIFRTYTLQEDEDATLKQAFRSIDVDGVGEISAMFDTISW
jgi:Ca2+-binding EF-hand superfamily protein